MSESVLPIFSSRSSIVSGLMFRYLIHFEFIFVYLNLLLGLKESETTEHTHTHSPAFDGCMIPGSYLSSASISSFVKQG